MNLRKRKGFTLIELIVVMAIIAILVLLAAPKYLNYTKDAHVTAMQQDAKVLSNIALGYNVKNDGVWPTQPTVADEPAFDALTGDITLAQVNTAITEGIVAPAVTDEDVIEFDDIALFDSSKVAGSLQGLKNKIEDYALVINGDHEGEVVFIKNILTNSDGTQYISVSPTKATLN